MRPVKLTISAFGPYAGRTFFVFFLLGTNGVYLVTGDTGAGKTTIFDAITYALYGEASGKNRKSEMFRSKYADASTDTFVELTFLSKGKTYEIKRIDEYDNYLFVIKPITFDECKKWTKIFIGVYSAITIVGVTLLCIL